MAVESPFDSDKAGTVAERLLATLNHGALCLMITNGHRTGLLDTKPHLAPATSAGIAAKAKLNERYVREWLGAMVTGRIIDVDPSTGQFSLPAEHAVFLTRAAGADNIGVFAQYIPLLAMVEDEIIECFKKGGGVPYANFPRFHEVMAEDSGQSVLSLLESHIVPLVPDLGERLSSGIHMLDVGCGSGRIMNRLAELYPKSRFTGMDLSSQAILSAWQEASAKKLRNVEFIVADLSNFAETAEIDAYDLVTTFDAIHDQAKPLNVLKGIHRTLRRDGVYLLQDIKGSSDVHKNLDHPLGTFLYTVSCMHCMTVSLAQGGEGLGAMWGEEKTCEYLAKVGFSSIEKHELAHDIQNNWYVVRK
jgi:ubiquinone/menaquinone biosynthesis C-methylase UbiE